jgi:hypothetical protein
VIVLRSMRAFRISMMSVDPLVARPNTVSAEIPLVDVPSIRFSEITSPSIVPSSTGRNWTAGSWCR